MVRCDDTGNLYAWEAGIHYSKPDRFDEDACCGNCEHIDQCPFEEHEVGICSIDDEWVRFEKEPCEKYEPMEVGR